MQEGDNLHWNKSHKKMVQNKAISVARGSMWTSCPPTLLDVQAQGVCHLQRVLLARDRTIPWN